MSLIASMRAACAASAARNHRARDQHSGLKGYYAKEREGADRLENLDELINAAAVSLPTKRRTTHPLRFLAHAALEAGDNQAQAGRCAQL